LGLDNTTFLLLVNTFMRRGFILAFIAGMLVFSASLWQIEIQEPPFVAAQRVVASLEPDQPLIQELDIKVVNLRSLTMIVAPLEATEIMTITAQLRLAASGLPPIRTIEQSFLNNSGERFIRLAFDPIRQQIDPYTATHRLEIRIQIAGSTPIQLLGGDLDPAWGGLRVGEEPLPQTGITLQPGYEYRILDLVWPISALAAGRSGLFGWPPFYALLAYSVLVGLIVSGWRLGRLWRENKS
jgi:hypothetical protein